MPCQNCLDFIWVFLNLYVIQSQCKFNFQMNKSGKRVIMKKSLIFIFLIFIASGCGSSGSSSVTYSWQINTWGDCTSGTQNRTVYCISSERKTVEDSNCSGTKPTTIQICSTSEIINDVGMKFVPVKRDSFQMGSSSGEDDEKPVHTVNITNDFYVGRYEVTNSQVVAVYNWAKTNSVSGLTFSVASVSYNGNQLLNLSNSSCQIAYDNDNSLSVKDSKDNYPCVMITWYGAKAFADFLNQKEGVTDKYRLLTEAEWEYAARGGTKSNGYTYSGSNAIGDVAWYFSNSSNVTHTVETKSPNELGTYNMSGNVFEWVQDRYDSSFYSKSSADNPINTSGSSYVWRGGAWVSQAENCRVTYRYYEIPTYSADVLGFRIAKSL